jgi:hypothetical protein
MVNIQITVLSDVTTGMGGPTFRENVRAPSLGQIGINIQEETAALVKVNVCRCFRLIDTNLLKEYLASSFSVCGDIGGHFAAYCRRDGPNVSEVLLLRTVGEMGLMFRRSFYCIL